MIATPLPWTAPSSGSLAVFLAVVAFVGVASVVGLVHGQADRGRRAALATGALLLWMGCNAAVAPQLEAFLPVSLPLYLACITVCTVLFVGSSAGSTLADAPLPALLAFQGFRLPLELVLHRWAEQGVIPESMTWTGQNIDIVAGVLGPVFAGLVLLVPHRARLLGAIGNTLCFLLLLNVIRVALLSAPGPLRVFGDPPLVLPMHVPTTWIVSVCVAGALAGHLITYRALYRNGTAVAADL